MSVFEQDLQALYFGSMPVEHIFLTEYMPAARGDYVKVYLTCLYHSRMPNDDTKVEDVSRELGLDSSVVENAVRYWERRGLMVVIGGEAPRYQMRSAIQRALSGEPLSADNAFVQFSERVYELFGESRKVRPSEISMAYEWVEEEGLSPDTVLALLRHMWTLRGAQFNFQAAGQLAVKLRENGVRDAADAESYLGFEETVHKGAQAVLRRLGRRRLPSEDELKLYRKWISEWGYTQEGILEACQATTAAGEPTFKYLDGILARLRQGEGGPADAPAVAETLDKGREELRLTSEMLNALGARLRPEAALAIYRELAADSPHDLIVYAAKECARNGKGTLEDLARLLESWNKRGLNTAEDAENYVRHVRELDTVLYRIYEACGYRGRASKTDRELLERWQGMGFEEGVLLLAAKQASGASSQKMKYMNTVLKNWQQNGVTTLAQAEKQAGRAPAAPSGKRVLAQQYEQREYKESEMQEILGVRDLFKEEPDGQTDS
ncbi:MAG: DnaD domain protein [Clostridia bacterium]|nr:DnaD domain protein [Clostridia bacterium]